MAYEFPLGDEVGEHFAVMLVVFPPSQLGTVDWSSKSLVSTLLIRYVSVLNFLISNNITLVGFIRSLSLVRYTSKAS